ncbi:hypothetical protein AAEX63_02365 [Luteococcus sp. H138]|uniref:hypothetical protein n=1 Tax=unclassified Luteococcus TaxID=2639923 RepID=UPI00313CF814
MTVEPEAVVGSTRRGWLPVTTLVLALLCAAGLPWAYLMGVMAPLVVALMVTVFGLVGSLVAVQQRRTKLFIANAVAAFALVPLMLVLVTLLSGP